jgi:hypothetical protein
LYSGIKTTSLQLTNVWATRTLDPLLPSTTNAQVGLYELLVYGEGNCNSIFRFELEINSQTNRPHSVDNLEELFGPTPATTRARLGGHDLRIGHAAALAPRQGIGISTVARTRNFHYLDPFASTHQDLEATLFHATGRTNGFSRWFLLQAEDTTINQLVTVDVTGSVVPPTPLSQCTKRRSVCRYIDPQPSPRHALRQLPRQEQASGWWRNVFVTFETEAAILPDSD